MVLAAAAVNHMLLCAISACIDHEIKRSKIRVTQLSVALPVWVFISVQQLRFSRFLNVNSDLLHNGSKWWLDILFHHYHKFV